MFLSDILTAGFNSQESFQGRGKGVPDDVSGLIIPRDPGLAVLLTSSATVGNVT